MAHEKCYSHMDAFSSTITETLLFFCRNMQTISVKKRIILLCYIIFLHKVYTFSPFMVCISFVYKMRMQQSVGAHEQAGILRENVRERMSGVSTSIKFGIDPNKFQLVREPGEGKVGLRQENIREKEEKKRSWCISQWKLEMRQERRKKGLALEEKVKMMFFLLMMITYKILCSFLLNSDQFSLFFNVFYLYRLLRQERI